MNNDALKSKISISDSNTDIKKRISDILPRISALLSEYHATCTKTGLFEGELGAALYQSHYYVITKDEKVLNLIYEHLGRSIQAFNNASQSFNLADGFTFAEICTKHKLRN